MVAIMIMAIIIIIIITVIIIIIITMIMIIMIIIIIIMVVIMMMLITMRKTPLHNSQKFWRKKGPYHNFNRLLTYDCFCFCQFFRQVGILLSLNVTFQPKVLMAMRT